MLSLNYLIILQARDYSMSDFDKLVNVGKGSFGRVDLVRNKRTCEMSALKIIDMLKVGWHLYPWMTILLVVVML